ncbi:MAG: hypothetical protein RSC68_03255 [Acinetobacter sp.]
MKTFWKIAIVIAIVLIVVTIFTYVNTGAVPMIQTTLNWIAQLFGTKAPDLFVK